MKRWTMFLLFTDGKWKEYTIEAENLDEASEEAGILARSFPREVWRVWFIQKRGDAS